MDLSQKLDGLTDQQGTILKEMEDLAKVMEANDDRFGEAKASIKELGEQMAGLQADKEKAEREKDIADIKKFVDEQRDATRAPSKAAAVAGRGERLSSKDDDLFYWNLWASKSNRFPELNAQGKAALHDMGGDIWQDPQGKATLGDTAAAGGNIVPPNVITGVIELATAINIYRNLLTVVDAGYVTGIDIPAESTLPLAATVQAYGATKTNLNLTVGKYSATMYTLAAIYDLGNQFIRNSRGAANQLVSDRLSRAIALGEANYILNGTNSGQPAGLLPALGTSGTFVTSFTASSTTLAGSSAAAIAKATGTLANRARHADGVVVNASDFWIMAAQGTDSAGFFFNPAGGPTLINPTIGMLRVWGLPVYADPNMPSDSMVVGEWKAATLYTGQTYRVDVSDVAGSRWDANETGFRGEEEIAWNAIPYVVSGLFQRVTDFTP